MTNPVNELALTPSQCPGKLIYEDNQVCLWIDDETARLFYVSCHAAGAIGQAQGESLLHALQLLEKQPVQRLYLHINSSGANFKEPLTGLFYLNAFLEALWQHRTAGMHLGLIVTAWLYGGMAMALASVVHEIVLAPSANMGLFGHRVSGKTNEAFIPLARFQPKHLNLLRAT